MTKEEYMKKYEIEIEKFSEGKCILFVGKKGYPEEDIYYTEEPDYKEVKRVHKLDIEAANKTYREDAEYQITRIEINTKLLVELKELQDTEDRETLIALRPAINAEMARFGFTKINSGINEVSGMHQGNDDKSIITIDMNANAIRYEQYEKVLHKATENLYIGKMVPFGVMAPLQEVINDARDAGFISSKFRHLNDKWEYSNVIPGTNGDGK